MLKTKIMVRSSRSAGRMNNTTLIVALISQLLIGASIHAFTPSVSNSLKLGSALFANSGVRRNENFEKLIGGTFIPSFIIRKQFELYPFHGFLLALLLTTREKTPWWCIRQWWIRYSSLPLNNIIVTLTSNSSCVDTTLSAAFLLSHCFRAYLYIPDEFLYNTDIDIS